MSVRVHFPYLCLYIQKRAGLFRPSAKLTERERGRRREGEGERERARGSLPRGWFTTWLHPNLFPFRTIPSLLTYSSLSRSYYEIALRLSTSVSSPPFPSSWYRLFLLLYLPPRSITIVSSLPALPLHFPHSHFSFPCVLQWSSLYMVHVVSPLATR